MKESFLFPIAALVFGLLSGVAGCGSGGNGEAGGGLVITDASPGSGSPPKPIPVTGINSGETALITEFPIPEDENGNITSPFGLALDDRANLWFSADITTQSFSPDMIGVFDTQNGIFPICETNQDVCRQIFPTASNSDPNQQQPPEFDAKPRGLVFDPFNGDLWSAAFGTGVIGKIEGQNNFRGLFEYPPATQKSGPIGITFGHPYVWFTEQTMNQIGRLDPAVANTSPGTGFEEFPLGPECVSPTGIDADENGNIWFACLASNKIGKLETLNGFNTVYFTVPTQDSEPSDLVVDAQGVIWFTEQAGDRIGRFDPNGGQFSEFPLPFGARPEGIFTDPDRNLIWFTENVGNRIGRLDIVSVNPGTSDGIEEFPIPTSNSGPTSLVVGSDGTVWFSQTSVRKIGKLTTPP